MSAMTRSGDAGRPAPQEDASRPDPSLADRGALLIGARRVGRVVAHRLARAGVHVALAYRRSRAEAEALAEELRAHGVRTAALPADITQEPQVLDLLTEARAALGSLSFLINLASGYAATPAQALDGAAWDRDLADARASFLIAAHGGRLLAGNPGPLRGHIVLCGDWAAAETPYRGYLPYLTAKAAIGFMTRAFAVEFAPLGIQVNAVAPGPMLRPPEISPVEWQEIVARQTPLGRQADAADLADVVLTLLRSTTITGEIIRVDSGRHLAGPGVERPAGEVT